MSFAHDHHDHSSCTHDHEPETILLYNEDDFEGMRHAGRLASRTLDFITPYVVPGVSTGDLDRLCHECIISSWAIPAPLKRSRFP